MLSGKELLEYRLLRGLSLRDVEPYCDVTIQLIQQVETGIKDVTEYNHRQIVDGINKAYFAKCNGTFERPPIAKNKPIAAVEMPKVTTSKKPLTKTTKTKK